jgi:hypothetical protein
VVEKRRWSVACLAALVGAAAVWRSATDVVLFDRLDVSLDVHPLTALATLSPGVFGLLLSMSAWLLARSRPLGATAYFASLFVGVGVLALQGCVHIGVSRDPREDAYIRWMYPDLRDAPFWDLMEVALLGVLLCAGRWLSEAEADERAPPPDPRGVPTALTT